MPASLADSDSISSGHREDDSATRAPTDQVEPSNIRFFQPEVKGIRRLSKKNRKGTNGTLQGWPGWETRGREPYHEYVHRLVDAGWDNLMVLDDYMSKDLEDRDLTISILDIQDDFQIKRHPDLRDEVTLKSFVTNQSYDGVKVRLYMVEQLGMPASGVIEALGSGLKLDPRFFQWNIAGNTRLLSPAQRHRAPFTSISFSALDSAAPLTGNTEHFRVSIYIQPDEANGHWTGVVLFNSHTKIKLSTRSLIAPPSFRPLAETPAPPKVPKEPRSLRELYLSTLEYIDHEEAAFSPFYATHFLFILNGFCWNQVIDVTRVRDQKINGISGTSVSQVEDIKKTFDVIQRGGSLGWKRSSTPLEGETKAIIEENFNHLLNQANLLWETRSKMATVRQQKREARISALTNSFTFFFAPIALISGIYGMNVSQISGTNTNPSVWQPVVATLVVNFLIVLALAISNWVHIVLRHNRKAGVREILGFAVGRR